VQTCRWGDYTAKPDHRYTYRVVALTGSPGQLTPVEEVSVPVRTEGHRLGARTIVFNRGAASSQAYATRFGNWPRSPPPVLTPTSSAASTPPRSRTTSSSCASHEGAPVAVWTRSTNITEGGIFGHSNLGHAITDPTIAAAYADYWTQLSTDPSTATLRPWVSAHPAVPTAPPPRGSGNCSAPAKAPTTCSTGRHH
jgi:hypothetical protein